MAQSITVDVSASDATLGLGDLLGVDVINVANAPAAISVPQPRRVVILPQVRGLTVNSLPSCEGAVYIVVGTSFLPLKQYGTVNIALDGTVNGLAQTAERVDTQHLAELADVDIAGLSDGDTLQYDAATGKFRTVLPSGGSAPSGGRAAPLSQSVTGSNGFTFNHTFAYDPEVWAKNAAGDPCEVGFTYSNGAVNIVFNQPFTGTVYLG